MDGEENARVALEAMRNWWWPQDDPEAPFAGQMELKEAVNRLAMEGQTRPQVAVLTLLCQGELLAKGDYRWRKYQWGSHFQFEETFAFIKPRQWKSLENSIEYERRCLAENEWPFSLVDLEKLGLEDCPIYEWDFSHNRFSTAACPPDTPIYDKSYFEEWFSAWDIHIWPRFTEANDTQIESVAVSGASKGGRPLADWWPDFVAELVAYTHAPGLPPGIGHQGQSEVIKEVSTRLVALDKEEPSRTQIQDVVNAVLRRMRLAGN